MKLLPPLLLLPALAPAVSTRRHPPAGEPAPTAEPDWRDALGRARAHTQDDDTPEPLPDGKAPVADAAPAFMPGPLPSPTPSEAPVAPGGEARSPVGAEPASPTVARMAAGLRQLAEPAPLAPSLARTWQVELPATAPGWQLQIAQAHPQAPLALELRVPPALALQAQQQLGDLDRRLRDAGHELVRSRLRAGSRPGDRRRPVDEVGP